LPGVSLSFNPALGWGHHNESLPISVVSNTVARSFSKLKLIKTFGRSTMFDEKLAILKMISIESETAKTFDLTDFKKYLYL